MATVAGSIKSIHLVGGLVGGDRKTLLLNCDFAVFTASDTAVITNAAVQIANIMKNGRTVTIKGALGANQAGNNASGAAIFASAATATASVISCVLGTQTTADASTTSATSGVGIYVTIDEA